MMDGRFAYLAHLCFWALPVLAFQVAALFVIHRRGALRILRAVVPPALVVSAWLIAADHLAISTGIWRFGEGRHLGLYVLNVPLEEVLFFILTNLLVAFGLALFSGLSSSSGARARRTVSP